MADSTSSVRKSKATKKPTKPYKDFPLFPHATKRWAKKIRGRTVYFGKWDDPDAALAKYLEQKDDLHAGRAPRTRGDEAGVDIAELCNAFLASKQRLVDGGELAQRSFRDYLEVCRRMVLFFGKHRLMDDIQPDDFGRLRESMGKTLGPVALGNEIGRVRSVFKFAIDSGLTEKAIRYGQSFTKPSRKTIRITHAQRGRRTYEACELRRIIDAAGQPLRAMILLGVNGGLGQSDIAKLPSANAKKACSVAGTKGPWLDYARPKTGIPRSIPLWPETVEALSEAIIARPKALDRADDSCAFLTHYGRRWVRTQMSRNDRIVVVDVLQQQWWKLLDRIGQVPRLGFYSLRHTHRTVSDGAKDQPAANSIMGHVAASNDMSAVYRESIDDDRLRAVVEHVRKWLWPK